MDHKPWMERKYWIILMKWLGIGVLAGAISVSSIKCTDIIGHVGDIVEASALLAVAVIIVLLLLAYARIFLPKLFRSAPLPKDTFFLRGVGLAFGWLLGSAIGLGIVTFLE